MKVCKTYRSSDIFTSLLSYMHLSKHHILNYHKRASLQNGAHCTIMCNGSSHQF